MATDDPATCEWLPVRTLYNKELHLADFLRDAGIEHFLPFKYELADAKTDGVECSRRLVPAIHNLVFIHHVYDRQWCIDLMRRCPVEFHFLKREREGLDYATISHREMEIFMRACDPRLTGTRFIDPEQLREKKFTRVRVVKPVRFRAWRATCPFRRTSLHRCACEWQCCPAEGELDLV